MFYAKLLAPGKLNEYLVDIDGLAEKMFFELVKQMSEKQGKRNGEAL